MYSVRWSLNVNMRNIPFENALLVEALPCSALALRGRCTCCKVGSSGAWRESCPVLSLFFIPLQQISNLAAFIFVYHAAFFNLGSIIDSSLCVFCYLTEPSLLPARRTLALLLHLFSFSHSSRRPPLRLEQGSTMTAVAVRYQ